MKIQFGSQQGVKHKIKTGCVIAALTGLSACAGGGAAYVPILDRPSASADADLADCQALAEQRSYDNADTRTGALIGAGLGGLVGLSNSYDGDFDDFVGGALIGGALGGGSAALQTREERKHIVLSCMAGRGHRVLG